MSLNPQSPDDTLNKQLSRKATITQAYNVTDALSLDELSKVRQRQVDSREQAAKTPAARPPMDRRGKAYWFGAR